MSDRLRLADNAKAWMCLKVTSGSSFDGLDLPRQHSP